MARSCLFRHLASATLIAGVLLGILAAPAPASTAQLVEFSGLPCKDPQCPQSPPPDTALVYIGGAEGNRVSLAADAQRVRIGDPAAQIDPGPGCSRVDDNSVSCSVPKVEIYVATGGGSDSVTSELGPASKLTVDGGRGNDVLVGGFGPDTLFGGKGADRLLGRDGDDRLFDASPPLPLRGGELSPLEGGDDVFRGRPLPPGRGRDTFDGGSGNDMLSYQGRFANLRIDLASRAPVAGARGEHDSIRRVENAIGGAGGDRIAGDRKANRLLGDGEGPGRSRGGDDRIVGRSGADIIDGGDGRNVLSGGPGDDMLSNGTRTFCGSGTDSVGLGFLAPDCEKPGFDYLDALLGGPLDVRSLLPLREGRPPRVLSGNLGCFLDYVCEFRAELRVRGPGTRRGTAPPRGTLLGSQSFTIGVREIKTVDLRLSSTGLRRLRRHRALSVSVSIATQHSFRPSSYLTLLRAP